MRILSSGLYLFWQMHRNARVVAPGIPYHVTQRGTNREQVFFAIVDRKPYLRLIRENLSEAGLRILAHCLTTGREGQPDVSPSFSRFSDPAESACYSETGRSAPSLLAISGFARAPEEAGRRSSPPTPTIG